MPTVSDTATEALRRALDEADPEVAYRLAPSVDGYTMKLDSPSEDDRIVESENRMVLLVTPEVDEHLSDAILDVEGGDEPTLTLRPVADTS